MRQWLEQYRVWLIVGLVAVVVGVSLGVAVVRVGAWWNAPQSARLPTLTPNYVGTLVAQMLTQTPRPGARPSATPTPGASPTPTVTPTPTPEPLCGGPVYTNILLIGSLRGYYDLADAIRIVHVDFTRPEVRVIAVPRDLIVQLPERSPYPSPVKLNQSYLLGTPAMWAEAKSPSDGAALLAETLALNFGVRVDHYVIVSGQGVEKIVDALGGVQVYIPEEIDDDATKLKLKPGYHTLNGKDYLKLLRIRGESGDLFRIKNQVQYLKPLLDRVMNPQIVTKWDDLVRLYGELVVMDLSPSEVAQFLCLGRQLSKEDIQFVLPPEDILELSVEQIYVGMQPIRSSVLLWDERFSAWLQEQMAP